MVCYITEKYIATIGLAIVFYSDDGICGSLQQRSNRLSFHVSRFTDFCKIIKKLNHPQIHHHYHHYRIYNYVTPLYP